jgi:hypothetical protein
MANDENSAASALNSIVSILERLDDQSRARVLKAVTTFFQSHSANYGGQLNGSAESEQIKGRPPFSANTSPSPKEFLEQKQPRTDVERVACLAYYLTHFREFLFFKRLIWLS